MHGDAPRPNDAETAAYDPKATQAVSTAAEPRIPVYPYYPGEVILPGYRLDKRLGSGGFGEVWRATAPGGMGVAIKILANLGRGRVAVNTEPCRPSRTSDTRILFRSSASG